MITKTILVIDDNSANLKLIRVLLSLEGYEVMTATNAESAMTMIDVSRPQLILMDLQLPGMDGLTLTRRLKSHSATCDIPIIALTSYAMRGDEDKASEAGCDGYITKPIDTRALPTMVARYLESNEKLHDSYR